MLYNQRVEEISPNIRYCAYNIGEQALVWCSSAVLLASLGLLGGLRDFPCVSASSHGLRVFVCLFVCLLGFGFYHVDQAGLSLIETPCLCLPSARIKGGHHTVQLG